MRYAIQAPSSLTACEADFIHLGLQVPPTAKVVIDMRDLGFLCPNDCMLLLLVTRHIYLRTGRRVELTNLRAEHHRYLDRIDFFATGDDWVHTKQPLSDPWSRNPDSLYVMGLEPVVTAADVQNKAVRKVRSIVETWLGKSRNTDDVVTVVAELCNNAREHSGEEGYVMVQKYARPGSLDIHVAVGDLGKGIRASLEERYRKPKASDSKFIELALSGLSSRGKGKGGDGLQTVDACTRAEGSSLLIRSGAALVRRSAGQVEVRDDLPSLPGTRAVVILRATA